MLNLRFYTVTAMIILLLMLIVTGCILYRTELALTPVVSEISPDGQRVLTVYMVGEPEWPFGETHCRFDLRCGAKRILNHSFSIHNDGAPAHENNFDVSWHEDHVQVLVSAEEQYDVTYRLYFDGSVEEQTETVS